MRVLELVGLLVSCEVLVPEIAAVVDDLAAGIEKNGNRLARYSVGKRGDDEIAVLCDFLGLKIFYNNINDAPKLGIYVGELLSCKASADKMLELENRMGGKTPDEFCSDIACGTYNAYVYLL